MKPNKLTNFITILKIKIWILSVAICLSSCTTPIPHERETISFDGNDETAGILGFLPDGSLEITPAAKEEYNSLCAKFGKTLSPPIEEDYGISPRTRSFSITLQAVEKWKEMQILEKRQRINNAK